MRVVSLHALMLTSLLVSVSADPCGSPAIESIFMTILKDHVLRVIDGMIGQYECSKECDHDKKCQSHNYYYDDHVCELNNRSKEARPDDLVYHPTAYYMDREDPVPLGSIPELPGNTCKEIKLSTPASKTGRYWIDPDNSNKSSQVVCDMSMEDVDECTSGTHLCPINSTCTNTKGSYDCLCSSGHKWNGTNCKVIKNCGDVLMLGGNTSGVYTVDPDGQLEPFQVYCDQNTSGGGWTVFQRRQDSRSVDFYRGWADYKTGFGNLTGEFWLGLDKIYRLTNQTRNRLRVELEDTAGNNVYAEYDYFTVSSENDKYRLSLGTYSGDAGDSLSYHRGQLFSTKDRDNDSSGANCAVYNKGAWWYKNCNMYSNLNGMYYNRANWKNSKGVYYSAKRAEMKIRPVGFKID